MSNSLIQLDTNSLIDSSSAVHRERKQSNTDANVRYQQFEDANNVAIERASTNGYNQRVPETYTVDEAVNALGFGRFQVKLSLITGLAWMADAMEMMILTILSPALHCDWWLSSWQLAMLTTIVFCGMMLSSTMWGNICDKYGRKIGLILCTGMTFYFGLISSLAPTYVWLLLLRGLTGFGIGGVAQSVTLYTEFLPTTSRAKCVVMLNAFWSIGACFEVILAYLIMESMGWRALLAISAVPSALFCILCAWLPESARYHMASGQTELAKKTLERIAKENGAVLPTGLLVNYKGTNDSAGGKERGSVRELLAEMRSTTLLLWFIWSANAFCYYGLVLFTTKLYEDGGDCHGGRPGDKDLAACSLECRRLSQDDYRDLLWTTVSEFPGLLVTAVIIECLGRKVTMSIEFVVYAIFTFLLYLCLSRAMVTTFLFIARFFISGAFQAAYVYTPEVYPTTLRAVGVGSCSGMARIGAITTPFIAQVAADRSLSIPIGVYACTAVVGAIASMLLPIETRGRQMHDTH